MPSQQRWPWAVLAVLILMAAGILFLELGSRLYYGEEAGVFTLPPARVCDPEIYPPDPTKLAALEDLQKVRLEGRRITSEELEAVLVAAPQEDLPYRNGVFCSGMVFVSQRLSPSARLYVARHELEHYFQMNGLDNDCEDWELCATWEAAREYPGGFLATITSSLVESYRSSPSLWDFLFGSWTIFKIYLLP